MKNPFSGLIRAHDKPQDSVSAAPVFYFGTSGSGKAVTVQTTIQLSTVYACVRMISETVASLPLGVYETVNAGNEKAMDHPLYRLLHDETNSEMTSFVFREFMLAHLLLYGNSYSQIIRNGKNTVVGLYCDFQLDINHHSAHRNKRIWYTRRDLNPQDFGSKPKMSSGCITCVYGTGKRIRTLMSRVGADHVAITSSRHESALKG